MLDQFQRLKIDQKLKLKLIFSSRKTASLHCFILNNGNKILILINLSYDMDKTYMPCAFTDQHLNKKRLIPLTLILFQVAGKKLRLNHLF